MLKLCGLQLLPLPLHLKIENQRNEWRKHAMVDCATKLMSEERCTKEKDEYRRGKEENAKKTNKVGGDEEGESRKR